MDVMHATYFVIGGAIFVLGGFTRLRKRRLMQDLPVSTIRGAAMGLVQIRGTAHADTQQKAPLSKKKCVWYRVVIEETNIITGDWKQVDTEEKGGRLFLHDETGICVLDPSGSKLDLPLSGRTDTSQEESDPNDISVHKDTRKSEYIITDGQELYVLANARPNEDERTKEKAPLLLGKGSTYFTVSDKPGSKSERRLLYLSALSTAFGAAIMIWGLVSLLS